MFHHTCDYRYFFEGDNPEKESKKCKNKAKFLVKKKENDEVKEFHLCGVHKNKGKFQKMEFEKIKEKKLNEKKEKEFVNLFLSEYDFEEIRKMTYDDFNKLSFSFYYCGHNLNSLGPSIMKKLWSKVKKQKFVFIYSVMDENENMMYLERTGGMKRERKIGFNKGTNFKTGLFQIDVIFNGELKERIHRLGDICKIVPPKKWGFEYEFSNTKEYLKSFTLKNDSCFKYFKEF